MVETRSQARRRTSTLLVQVEAALSVPLRLFTKKKEKTPKTQKVGLGRKRDSRKSPRLITPSPPTKRIKRSIRRSRSLPAKFLSSPEFLETCLMAASNSPHRRNFFDSTTPFGTPTPSHTSKLAPPATGRRSPPIFHEPRAPYTVRPRSNSRNFTSLRRSQYSIPHTTNVLGMSHRNELNRRKAGITRRATTSPDPSNSENSLSVETGDVSMEMDFPPVEDPSKANDDNITLDELITASPMPNRRSTGLFATPGLTTTSTPKVPPPQFESTTPFGTPGVSLFAKKQAPVPDSPFPTTPRRNSGLRRYIKQHGINSERPNFAKSRPLARQSDFATPLHPASQTRKVPLQDCPPSADSATPFALRKSASAYGRPAEERPLFTERKPVFSKSLNSLAGRHSLGGPTIGVNDSESWVTPQNYKFARPNQAAFHSTGFVPKRGRNLTGDNLASHQPETPCKKPASFNPRPKANSPGGASIFSFNRSLQRIDSFCSMTGGDDNEGSPSGSLPGDFDLPPTPTKRGGLFGSLRGRGDSNGSPLGNRSGEPQTPSNTTFTSDASLLATAKKASFFANSPTGTPTKGYLDFLQPSKTPFGKTPFKPRSSSISSLETSPAIQRRNSTDTLTQRFAHVKLVGTGEFSEVFMVTEGSPSQETTPDVFGNIPSTPGNYDNSFSTPPQRGNRSDAPTSGRTFAVKKFKQQYHGIRDRERKLEEVNILKALGKNSHVIEYIDSWEDDRKIYIMTEYCEGGSLDRFLDDIGNKGRLDEFRVWKILLELCMGVSHIHNSGFIHLDIKPANVLIASDGTLKISDFGMASKWPAPNGIEREGDKVYIAPEILQSGRYDKPADIFSLGLAMIEIAVNETLPPNGPLWQSLRQGDLSVAPVLSTSRSGELIIRDDEGVPIATEPVTDHDSAYASSSFSSTDASPLAESLLSKRHSSGPLLHKPRPGDMIYPPPFMEDNGLERIISAMICDEPRRRLTADQILALEEIQWVNERRNFGATIFEGLWGPDLEENIDLIGPAMEASAMDQYDGEEDWRMEM